MEACVANAVPSSRRATHCYVSIYTIRGENSLLLYVVVSAIAILDLNSVTCALLHLTGQFHSGKGQKKKKKKKVETSRDHRCPVLLLIPTHKIPELITA